ncbi:MAG: PucR family transcriptional regulator ligand-binding domain-containing protein [Bacillota bacterium]|nr:PucR family transcriptional regulator ligand-binding domain-containing protein [Bacillota bacterium]
MKVTIKDCLELDAFRNATVLSGENSLDGEVRAVSVLDVCDEEDYDLIGGDRTEILLTRFLNAKNDTEKQCRLVKAVAEKGCAALAVFSAGKTLAAIDESLVEAARQEGLVLIKMPPAVSYSQVISDVMDEVLYGENFSNSLISNTIFHLLNFEKHASFQAAVKEAAINNDFQLILLSEDFNPVLTIETRHKATVADAIRLGRERNVGGDSGKVYTMIDVNGVLTYWGPVDIGTDKYYMFIVDNEDSYTAGEITKLAEIIELAMGMWKYTPERDAKSEFIKALIRGNKSLAYTLQDEAKLSGGDIVSVFLIKGIDKEREAAAFAEFEKKTDMEILKIAEEDETYGMILKTEDSEDSEGWQADCTELFGGLKENKGVRIFHVTGLNGIEGAGDGYKLISESWNFVQSVFPYKRVFTKYEMTLVNNCINIQIQGGFVKKNYVELLEPFKALGEHKSRQLLETLETFVLDAGMNSGKTAEFMNIHANTVQYRLKKINEMLGVEVTGNRVIPGLTMALALKRLERVVS